MQQPFATLADLGMVGLPAPLQRFGMVSRTAQSIGIEWFDFVKQSCDDLTTAAERLTAIRTPADALVIHAAFMQAAGAHVAARAAVIGGLVATLTVDLLQPAVPARTR